MANPDRHPNEAGQFILPPAPAATNPSLVAMIGRYRSSFLSEREEDAPDWIAAADEIDAFVPGSRADLAAKLTIAIHYRDPERCGDKLAIEAPDPSIDRRAVEMELSCLDWLLGQMEPIVGTPWATVLVAYRAAQATLDAHPRGSSDDAIDAAVDAFIPFETALLSTPAPDISALGDKLRILMQPHRVPNAAEQSAVLADVERLAGMS